MFECERFYVYFLAVVGVTAVVLLAIYLLNMVAVGAKLFMLSRFFPPNVKKYGEWAVITGSTDGIGKSYARELARRGMNIVLVSRSLEKLRNTARALEDEFKINVDIIQADFTRGWELHDRIKNDLKDKEVGILVNNVGLMAPQPCYFLTLSDRNILDIVHVNITSLLLMTTIVLPEMLKRKRGAIVTMSSMMSLFVIPLAGVYGASKAAINSIGLALTYENATVTGIDFQTLVLSCVTTNLLDYSTGIFKLSSPFMTDADSYAKSAINTLGLSHHTTGYLGHSMQLALKILPDILLKYIGLWGFQIQLRQAGMQQN